MTIVLFEDLNTDNLQPLVYFRPVWELRCGATTLREKLEQITGSDCLGFARDYLQTNLVITDMRADLASYEEAVWINARWIATESQWETISKLQSGEALTSGEDLVAARLTAEQIKPYLTSSGLDTASLIKNLNRQEADFSLIKYVWQLVEQNGTEITADFHRLVKAGIHGTVDDGVHLLKPEQIYIAEGSRIKPGVVIDAEHGPVWIAENVTVMPNAVLEGPLYVGPNCTIKIAAKIYENTTIGPWCKIGGELEESIVQGYSNKQHDGFLGHAYLGSWVNLGADTNNSDLKNNYGIITALVNGEPVSTGSQFVGLMMGDHSKSAINMMFNTGTIVGVNSNIFCTGMPPKFVPSFSWGGDTETAYGFEKAVEVAAAVMKRRKVTFSDADMAIFKAVWQKAKTLERGSPIS